MTVHTTYDPDADACYIGLGTTREGAVRSRVVLPGVQVDIDSTGKLVGIEILGAAALVHADVLSTMAPPAEWLTLKEAGALIDRSPETLRVLLHTHKLNGRKQGRDWVVERTAIEAYVAKITGRVSERDRVRDGEKVRQSKKAAAAQRTGKVYTSPTGKVFTKRGEKQYGIVIKKVSKRSR